MSPRALVMAAGLPAPGHPQSGSLVTGVCSPLVLRRKERGPENRPQTPGRWPDLWGPGLSLGHHEQLPEQRRTCPPVPTALLILHAAGGGRWAPAVPEAACPWLAACRACQVAVPATSLSLSRYVQTDVCSPQLISNFAPTEGKDTEPTAKLQAQRRETQTYSSTLLRWFRQP